MLANWVLPFIITITYTVTAVILGISAKGKLDMKIVENWSVSGNTLGLFVMVFLIGAGNISAFTFMGAPGWGYAKGVAGFYVLVYLCLMAFTGYIVNPRINMLVKKDKMITQAEAMGVRYESKFLRALSAFVGGLGLIGLSLVQVIGCGYILNIMSGGHIPVWAGQIIIVVAIFSYVYTSGLKAIGWTNVVQGILMFTIAFLVGGILMIKTNGSLSLEAVFTQVASVSPAHLTLPGALGDMPPRFWTTAILISVVTFWPSYWTAASGAKSPDAIRKSILLTPAFYLIMVPMIVVGFICVYAFPEYSGPMDKAAITYALNELPWWVSGLLGAGVLAASQSTVEMHYHTTALTLSHDLVMPYAKNKSPEREGKVQRLMLIPVMFGLSLPLAIYNPANLVYIYLVAYGFVGQLFPLFIGLFMWPRSTKAGAIAGLLVGVAVVTYCNFAMPNPLGIHAGIWGMLFNLPVHVIVSLLTKPSSENTLKKFFSEQVMDRLYIR